MNAQADWWLLLLGLGLGAGLTWLVLAEMRRHDDDVAAAERAVEAAWIADTLSASGTEADGAGIEEVLRLHRLYLASLPFDEPAWVSGSPTWPIAEHAAGPVALPEPPGSEPRFDPTPSAAPSSVAPPADPAPPSSVPPSAGDATLVEGDGTERQSAE